ncbi:MAG: ATP-binding protein, partial [Rikenellaceae bacterium]
DDLDPAAIQKARELYTLKNPRHAEQIPTWDDETFLNKAKITIRGKITNAAIVLLGKVESEVLISPSVAKIKWILKDTKGFERDYLIEGSPFVLAIDNIYEKIRNLKYRYINPLHKTLFPEEIDTYDPNVIREAIYNAVAHQDYTKGGQINVVEFDDKLVFSNLGGFIPVTIDNVLQSNAPQELYRNKFLVDAMVGLNMVDTIGSGIKNMYKAQRRRLFPLPIYDISADRVEVTIIGKIMDMNYANILAQNSSLSLMDIELLNRVQLNRAISDSEVKYLRKSGLIEGRMPNIYISKDVAQKTKQNVEYSKHKGLESRTCEELLLSALRDHKKLSKKEIVDLWWNALPSGLNDTQKKDKIRNMLSKMRKLNKITNIVVDGKSYWELV